MGGICIEVLKCDKVQENVAKMKGDIHCVKPTNSIIVL